MLDAIATVTDNTIMAAVMPADSDTTTTLPTTTAHFASIHVFQTTENLNVMLLGGINLTSINASNTNKLMNSWEATPTANNHHRRRRLVAETNLLSMCASRLLIATTTIPTTTQFTVITIIVVVAGSLLSKIGAVTNDESAISTLASQAIDTWASMPHNSFSTAWHACTGISSALFVSPVRVAGINLVVDESQGITANKLPIQPNHVGAGMGGAIGGLVLVVGVFYYFYHRKQERQKEELRRKNEILILPPRAEAAWPNDIYVDADSLHILSHPKSAALYKDYVDDDNDVTVIGGDEEKSDDEQTMVDNASVEAEADTHRAAMRHQIMMQQQNRIEPLVTTNNFSPPLRLTAGSSAVMMPVSKDRPKWGVGQGKKSTTVISSGRSSRSESSPVATVFSNRSSQSI